MQPVHQRLQRFISATVATNNAQCVASSGKRETAHPRDRKPRRGPAWDSAKHLSVQIRIVDASIPFHLPRELNDLTRRSAQSPAIEPSYNSLRSPHLAKRCTDGNHLCAFQVIRWTSRHVPFWRRRFFALYQVVQQFLILIVKYLATRGVFGTTTPKNPNALLK